MENQLDIQLSANEEAYRRGYLHGFVTGRTTETEYQKVREWRYSNDTIAPPGSGMEGMHLDGLKKDEEHRFFINRTKENWNS